MSNQAKQLAFVMGVVMGLTGAGLTVAAILMRSWSPMVAFGLALVAIAVTIAVTKWAGSVAERRWP